MTGAVRINTRYSIALHCLVLITEFGDRERVTSELLGKSTGCNAAAVRSILSSLQRAGIISIVRGVGGAHLNLDPRELNLWEVYHALEPDGLGHLIGVHPNPLEQCPVGKCIYEVLDAPYEEIGAAVRRSMEGITLSQLMDRYHRISAPSSRTGDHQTETEC